MPFGSLAYEDNGSGPPVLLLHAFPFDRRFWDGVTPGLVSEGFRVITPDLLGFGKSVCETAWTIDDQATAVSNLLDAIRVPKAAIVGLSMGGYVALSLAANHSHKVASLVLADTKAANDSPQAREARTLAIDVVTNQGVAVFCDGMLPKLLAHDTSKAVRRSSRELMNQPKSTILTAIAALRDRTDRREGLGAIAVPTLVVGGEFDAISTPQEGSEIAAAIPNARFKQFDGVGHLSNLESPVAFVQTLSEFLKT
jgi:3-oxoadipate enol-lactonase